MFLGITNALGLSSFIICNLIFLNFVVIPILSKEGSDEIMSAAQKIVQELKSQKIRVKLDDRDIRPGQKYYDWEIKGVPLRIELGPRDLQSNSFMCARRTGEKSSYSLDELLTSVRKELDLVDKHMKENAKADLKESFLWGCQDKNGLSL